MRNKFVLIATLLSWYHYGYAQLNMIRDASFENVSATVNGSGQSSLLEWKNLDSTRLTAIPSFYLSYATMNPPYILPDNQWCHQDARSGFGVIALDFIWTPNPFFKRSLTRTKLKHALQAGKTYCAKMHVNPCERYYGFFSDGIAMYFDNGQLDTIVAQDSSGVYTFVNPQVSNPTGNVFTDTVNWVAVSGLFTATGNETFLTIGNFKSDAATIRLPNLPHTAQASALMIDDVSVIEVTASNWLKDTTIAIGDSVYIGLPIYEMPDALWYTSSMVYIGKGSGIKVKPTQAVTQYIQAIDVCSSIIYDTLTVYAYPLVNDELRIMDDGLWIYPNPVNDILNVELRDMNDEIQKIELYNAVGQLVYHSTSLSDKQAGKIPNSTFQINVANLAKGFYYLKAGLIIKKIIVQ